MPQEPEDRATVVAAGAGTALGLGLLAYYWGIVKFWLLGTLLAPFFSRIDKAKLLDNKARSRMFDAIEHNPGITIKEITDVCGVGWGTAVYHLKRLEDERLVTSQRHRQFRRYYKNGGLAREEKHAVAELKHDTAKALAKAVMEHPGSAQKDLCAQLGISAPLAHKYLGRMAKANLVTQERQWREVKYFPTELLGSVSSTPLVAAPAA
jgi:predicted transcriptional regulator